MGKAKTVPIRCDGPGPHEPKDGVLGKADRVVTGMRCSSEACQPVVEPSPVDEALEVIQAVRDPDVKTPTVQARLAALEALAVPR